MPEIAIKTMNSNLDKKVNVKLAHEENVAVSILVLTKTKTSDSRMCILPETENTTTFSLYKTCTKVVKYETHSDAGLEPDKSLNDYFNPREPSEWPDTITGNECQIIAQMGLHGESDLQAMAENLLFDLEGMKFPSYLLYTKALNSWEKLARDYLVSSKTKCLFCGPC